MNKSLEERIGNNIRQLREHKKLSQAALANLLGVDRSYISSLENGKRNPSIGTLTKISNFLGVPVEELIAPSNKNEDTSFMQEFEQFSNEDPWMLAEEIPDIDFFFSHIWQTCFVGDENPPSGRTYKKILSIHRGWHLWFYFGEDDAKQVGDAIVKKMITEPDFVTTVNNQIVSYADQLRDFSNTIPDTHLSKLSSQALLEYYLEHIRIHYDYYRWAWIPVAVDMFHNNFTDRLKKYLEFNLEVPKDMVNEYFIILTQPREKSLIQEEREEFLKIGLEIQNDEHHRKLFEELYIIFDEKDATPEKLRPHTPEYEGRLESRSTELRDQIKEEVYKKIQAHYQKYFYVKFMFIGKEGVHSFDHYLKELVKLVGRKSDIKSLITAEDEKYKTALEKQDELFTELAMPEQWKNIFTGFGEFMVTKIYRRYSQIYGLYRLRPIFEEIARRLDVTLKEMTFMLPEELKAALMKGKVSNKEELVKRSEFCVFYAEKGKEVLLTGKEAQMLADQTIRNDNLDMDEFEGQTGCIGKARGIVKIITRPSEMHKMNKGDILVSIATDPDIISAMEKAAAFVTEQGGVTSHAAIVAREMNKPCVIGTKIATRVLSDGDEVEVDATRGIVRIIKRASDK